jgi:hypothetical protein
LFWLSSFRFCGFLLLCVFIVFFLFGPQNHRICPLIISCTRSYVCIVILDIIHLVLYVHVFFLISFICTCHYLIIGINVSQSTSSSKLNFRFVSSLTVLYWKGHNSSIRSVIEVNEHIMEILFDKLSNRSGPTSISCRQGLQIIKIFCRCFCRVLRCRRRLVIHTWDLDPS